jgi:hypothetical protein
MKYRRLALGVIASLAVGLWITIFVNTVLLTKKKSQAEPQADTTVVPVAPLPEAETQRPPRNDRSVARSATFAASTPNGAWVGPLATSPEDQRHFERLRSAPRLFNSSGSPDRLVQGLSNEFTDRFKRELPADLAGRIKMGKFECYRSGCVVPVDYNGDAAAGGQFEAFMMGSEAFNRWPGPKMKIEDKPGDRSSGAQWCFFKSSEEAVAMLAE